MPTELEKRAAALAVSRCGAEAMYVEATLQQVLRARADGRQVDFLDALVRAELLTPAQALELRESLDQTQIDPKKVVPARQGGARSAPPPAAERDALQTINEYRVLRKLGEGGMGSVYLAYQESANRQVAIKVLAEHLTVNASLVERFEREAQHALKLNHANIVRGYGVGKDNPTGRRYIVMEYVDGPSVQALLDRHGKLALGDAVHIVLDIAHALEHAQSRNIIHRDIKPENILLTRTGVAKLADLGLAKQTDQTSHLTATRQGFGTPYYMPYEQAINAKYADGRSDIFALGATLYHLVTGQVPFKGETQLEILEKKEQGLYPPAYLLNRHVPEELSRILDKMMAREPADRYQTASELIVDLDRSKLAAPVLSFVDHELAMQDPLVRQRAASARQTTQPDLQNGPSHGIVAEGEIWYLRFHDKDGKLRTAKATTKQVLQRIRQGRLNGTAQASHSPAGQFRRLSAYLPFRDAMREQDEALPSAAKVAAEKPAGDDLAAVVRDKTWWIAVVSAAAVLGLLILSYLLLLR